MFDKKRFLDNNRVIKRVGEMPPPEQWQALTEFIQIMIKTTGPEDNFFLGTGSINGFFDLSDMESDYSSGKKTFNTNNFISEGLDVSVGKVPRYFDLSEMLELINIFYVLDGCLNIFIDNNAYYLERGNVLILSPYILHNYLIDNDDTIVLHLMIRESTFQTSFSNILDNSGSVSEFFYKVLYDKKNAPFAVFKSPFDEELKNSILKIILMQYENGEFCKLMTNNLAEYFVLLLFSQYKDSMTFYFSNTKNNILVSNILSYMYENYATITLKSLSEKFSYTTIHITRVLNQVLGRNYQEIITDIRLNKAQELLTNTNLSIENICSLIGYNNSRHLRQLFKKTFGVSPGQFRKQLLNT